MGTVMITCLVLMTRGGTFFSGISIKMGSAGQRGLGFYFLSFILEAKVSIEKDQSHKFS